MSETSSPLDLLARQFRRRTSCPERIPIELSEPGEDADRPAAPYPGLRPFLPEESQFFCGRDVQIREIGERLARERCVSVLGGSGSGKSSIVLAGVIPALRRKLIAERGDLWRAAILRPGVAPIKNLVIGLERTLKPEGTEAGQNGPERLTRRQERIRDLLYQGEGLGAFLPLFREALDIESAVSAQAREQANLLVVIDQFEELFRGENLGKVQVATLVGLIVDFWRRRESFPGLFLAITMRTDDLHRCAEFIDLPDFINATSYLTRRLRLAELRDAIVLPIRPALFRAGLLEGEVAPGQVDLRPYDVEVVTELLDAVEEIGHDPDHLPLLQHLLAVTWRQVLARWRRELEAGALALPPRIVRDDLAAALGYPSWDALGAERAKVQGARQPSWLLRECLDRVGNGLLDSDLFGTPLTQVQRTIARTAFCLMGEVDDRGNFKRRFTSIDEVERVAGPGTEPADIQSIIRRFTLDHRFIWKRSDTEIDVCHEALMRNWHRLREWLIEDRKAAAAYRQLAERYDACCAADSGWPSQLARWLPRLHTRDGLLGADALDLIVPALSQRTGPLGFVVPRYNEYWARRSLNPGAPTASDPGGSCRRLPPEPEPKDKERFKFLRRSMRRSAFFRWLPVLTLVLAIVVLVQHGYWQKEYFQSVIETQRQAAARQLWDALAGWTPVPDRAYVNALWSIRAAPPEMRSDMVLQLGQGTNIQIMGFRPAPIIRAIGLVWPSKAREGISRAVKEQLANPAEGNRFRPPALACASALLAERLDPDCLGRAVAQAEQDLLAGTWSGQELWPKGRILACMGPRLPEATRQTAVYKIFSDQTLEDAKRRDRSLGGIASAVTSASWTVVLQGRALGQHEQAVQNEVAHSVLEGAIEQPSDDWAILSVRPLASLIATMDPPRQRALLERILQFAPKVADMGKESASLMLVLAQAFELVAEGHRSAGIAGELGPLIARAWADWGDTTPRGQPPNRTALARLILPLVEVAGASEHVRSDLAKLADQVRVEDLGSVALWGRHLALSANRLGDTRASVAVQTDQLVKLAGSVDGQRATPSTQLAKEGLARGLAALAGGPDLSPDARGKALAAAQRGLAWTGSAEEAAAWAGAVVALIEGWDAVRRAEVLVEVLKYPTAGLTAREPNAREPRNATDILIRALVEVLDPSLGFEQEPDFYLKVVKRLAAYPRLAHIDLERGPWDPRAP